MTARDLKREETERKAVRAGKLYRRLKSLKQVGDRMGLRSLSWVSELVKRGLELLDSPRTA